MNTTTTSGRGLAIAAAAAFTTGGLVILLGDVIATPAQWTIYHALTILTVGGTIAAGHLMADAWRGRHMFAAIGFLALFLAGTSLVVYQSVGRQAETTDTKALSVEARNQAITAKQTDLDRARARLADAEAMVDKETRNRGCGRSCNDWRRRVVEVRAHVQVLEAEVARLGAPAPVAPKAAKMAAVMALFGADEAQTKAALLLLEPFLWTLFFEIGSVISIGFAARRRPAPLGVQTSYPTPSAADLETLLAAFHQEAPSPTPPRPPRGGKPLLVARNEHPLIEELKRGGPANSQDELAQRLGLSKGEVSKTVSELANRLKIQRAGRCNRIALAG